VTDRDLFAASALAGMLGQDDTEPHHSYMDRVCRAAFAWADAMLWEKHRSAAQEAEEPSKEQQ